jgi:hypothetical protein
MKLRGGGLWGDGVLLPFSDVRGMRIGISARKLLLQLPTASEMPLEYSAYDEWHLTPRPIENALGKVVIRLWRAGLIWRVCRFDKGSYLKYTLCCALTPLGAEVVKVFGDDMRRGQRIRWSKWERPSVAFSEDICRQMLQGMNLSIADDIDSKTISRENTPKLPRFEEIRSYGTGRFYTLCRLAAYDRIWSNVLLFPQVMGGGHISDFMDAA